MRSRAIPIDARYLHVECPKLKGITIQVTDVRVSQSNRACRLAKVYIESLCKYCGHYHYFQLEQGSTAELPALEWNA